MRIALVASEMVPMVKVGGLADVAGSLAGNLKKLGHQVTVFIPYYGNFDLSAYSFAKRLIPVRVGVSGRHVDFDVYECKLGTGVEIRALGSSEYLERNKTYTDAPDEPVRFGVFSKAVALLIGQEPEKFDILHCNDWHTSLVPFFLKARGTGGDEGGRIPVALTIHNLVHQGLCSKDIINTLDLGWDNFTPRGIEFYGKVNFFKAGLISSDGVTTVSPNYAREILNPAEGAGLEGVLRSLKVPFRGILNGIDVAKWDPQEDRNIAANYGARDLSGKEACKIELQKELGLHVDPEVSLLGVVARLTPQKGIDLVMAILPRLLRCNVQLAVLGEGQKDMEERLVKVLRPWKGRAAARVAFDEALSHGIYSASDIFLSPSRFEPCGLSTMIAMRYGAVPVARATGGLVDTVVDVDRHLTTGSGFVFSQIDPVDCLGAILRAVSYHRNRGEWSKLVKRIMSGDYSWEASAKKYEALYNEMKR